MSNPTLTYRQWVILQAALSRVRAEESYIPWDEDEDGPSPTGEELDAVAEVVGRMPHADKPTRVYRVTLAGGATHDVPVSGYDELALAADKDYTPDTCDWWDDIVAYLWERVPPGAAEVIEAVRVVPRT